MISEFNQIFNNRYVSEVETRISIIEREPSATVSSTHFLFDKFYQFDIGFLDHFNSIFSSNKLIDDSGYGVGCDGVFLVKKDDKWYLCLCELKSKFGLRTFVKSKLQLEVTYLKLIKLFKVLKGFNQENFQSILFIVSNKPDLSQVKERIESVRERNTYTPAHLAYQELVKENVVQVTDSCCRLSMEPIKNEYTTINQYIHFIEGDNVESDLNSFLN